MSTTQDNATEDTQNVIAELRQERDAALAREAALAEVLGVIACSTGENQQVFDLIAQHAAKLCNVPAVGVALFDGIMLHLAAQIGFDAAYAKAYAAQFPRRVARDTAMGRAILSQHVVQIDDIGADPGYGMARPPGPWSALAVPLVHNGLPLGVISIGRPVTGLFPKSQVTLLQTFADQAVIAMENARLITEQREALEQQTATAEVLQVINASRGDLAPVFETIVTKAHSICSLDIGSLATYDGTFFRTVATRGYGDQAEAMARTPYRPLTAQRALLRGDRLIHVPDLQAYPVDPDDTTIPTFVAVSGFRALLMVPLRIDGTLLGFLTGYRKVAGPFSEKQIVLLENFAAQAVIAMENARLITEQREALEQQTATAEVLQVINASPGNLAPVFDAVLERSLRLCGASFGTLLTFDGERLERVALLGVPAVFAEWSRHNPLAKDAALISRGIEIGKPVQATDVETDAFLAATPSVRDALVNFGGVRALLQVPLLKDGTVRGFIAIFRKEPGRFPENQIALLEGFAAQAVIAMENARLLTELRQRTDELAGRNSEYGERIEQQAATIDVLKVMSASPGDTQPVFDLIVNRARAFCEADQATVALLDGEMLHLQAQMGGTQASARSYAAQFPRPVDTTSLFGRAILARDAVQTQDVWIDAEHFSRTRVGGAEFRAIIAVPLLRRGIPIGAIALGRRTPGEFSATQLELLLTFADQAVIAVGSAEAYRELHQRTSDLQESLEYQTATGDVLRVISRSTFDLQPVLDTLVETAARLCDADMGAIGRPVGNLWRMAANFGFPPEFEKYQRAREPYPLHPDSPTVAGRAMREKAPVQIHDVAAVPGYPDASIRLGKQRTSLGVPLLREGEVIGHIVLARQRVEPFTERQVALVSTFADQAVIAIENTHLLSELQERTAALAERNSEYGERIEHQSATIDVLKAMSTSPSDPQPVFDLIARHANSICNGNGVGLFEFDGSLVHLRAHLFGDADDVAVANYKALFPMVPTRESISCRAILDKQIIHVADYQADPEIHPSVRAMGYGAQLSIPVMRDGSAIGVISLGGQLGGFTDSQIALLQTFAEQAAIAITSAGTFRALQNRTAELTRSVAELQALEEVLRAVNSSLDLDTVLDTIISRAAQLSQADEGTIYEFDDSEEVFVPKVAFGMSTERVSALRERRIKLGETHLGRSALQRAPVHVEDVQHDPSVPNAGDVLPGIHAVLAVPLLRNDTVIGGLVIRRRTEEGFPTTIVTLMQTFAGQAVLAIENARLFQEAGRARTAAELALTDLQRTQDRLVQTEKMASLGQLTAGIAHEIKNPLNFVNNFSDLSVDLLNELSEAVAPGKLAVADSLRAEIDDITTTLKGNLEKIAEHGRRADSIVKNMLLHSRTGPSEHRAIDLNMTVDEALNLAYHGARAETPGFNITMEKDLDPKAGAIDAFPQELLRVMLNLISNGFYAARKHANDTTNPGFEPTIRLTTRDLGDQVEIRVRDNGTGVPIDIRDKLFQPFFTTKPTGEGTGLGLSISYDIVTKQHGGTITVDSVLGDYTEFTISLPRRMFVTDDGRT